MPTYKIGDLVWAKMKGFPKWPGVVAEPTRELKATKKTNHYCIYFFGSNNYAWIEPKALEPYSEPTESKTKSGAFKDALASIEHYKLTGEGGPIAETETTDLFDQLIRPIETPGTSERKVKKISAKKRRHSKDESEGASSDGESSSTSLKIKGPRKSDTPRGRPKKSLDASSVIRKKKHLENYAADTTTDSLRVLSPSSRLAKGLINKPEVPRPVSPTLDLSTVSQTLISKQVVPSNKIFGFIGLGIMGGGIVKNLLNSHHDVHIWDRSPERAQEFTRVGAKLCMTPSDVMNAADIVFSCVANPEAATSLVFGNCGVLGEVNSTKAFVEMSGVDPDTSTQIGTAITEHGGRYLEAQLQGSKAEAEEGTLIILAAGDRSLFNDVASCLEAIGRASFFLGGVGSATRMNLILQQLMGISIAGLAESLALAERSGLNQAEVMEIIGITSVCSPLIAEKGRNIVECSFNHPGLALKYMQKDLGLALKLADEAGVPTPCTAIAYDSYKRAKRSGYADNDMSSVYVASRY